MLPMPPDEMPLPDAQTRRVRESFAAQGLMGTLGATLGPLAPGRCTIIAPIRAATSQQQGFAHAGLTFAIGDSSCGYAALTTLSDGVEVVTAEMKIHLLAPATGERLVAEGRVIKPGKRLIITQSEVFAETGAARRHVATLLGTIVPVPA